MTTLTNKDLFLFLKDLGPALMYQEQLFDFVVKKLDINLSEKSESQLKNCLRSFCSNAYSRWQKSNRTYKKFEKKNDVWLNREFKIPVELIHGHSDESMSTSSTSHRKSFSDSTERHKRRRTQNVRESNSSEVLLHATKQKLANDGSSDMAKILDYLIKNPNEIKRVRAFCENRIDVPLYSKEKCLAVLLSLNLSKSQYINLRETCIESGTNQYVSYYNIQQAKLECYPPKDTIKITESIAMIKLQALLDLTSARLLEICKQNLDCSMDLKLICKWGFDGASSQSIYKQKFQIGNILDNSIFMTSFVPIKLVNGSNVIWMNKNPFSTRYCRPIKFEFVHENAEVSKKEYERMQSEIMNLTSKRFENIIVNYEMLFTMIDGKVCTALSDTVLSCSTCYLYGAKPSEMNNIDKVISRNIDINTCNFGISSLHAKIRCMEFLLHVSYNLSFKKWNTRDPVHKK